MRVICKHCGKKASDIPETTEYGFPVQVYRCSCGKDTKTNILPVTAEWWEDFWLSMIERIKKEGNPVTAETLTYHLSQESKRYVYWVDPQIPEVSLEVESTGSWPEHSLDDMRKAVCELNNLSPQNTCQKTPTFVYIPLLLRRYIDSVVPNTGNTYSGAMKERGGINDFIHLERGSQSEMTDRVFVTRGNTTVKIKNIVVLV